MPWVEVDRLIVHGERIRDAETGNEVFRYPSYRELARRYGVAVSLVGKFARQRNCMQRRKNAQGGQGDESQSPVTTVTTMSEEEPLTFSDLAKEIANDRVVKRRTRPLSNRDQLAIIDACLRAFANALDEGRIKCDSPSDLHTLLRLREKLDEDTQRAEAEPEITLEQIQARHKALREQLEQLDDRQTGMQPPR
ncbi:MAG: hypothetical protein MJE77_23625 [Proteobacteria bacterium]|nr:hypothetical protein [Pseudomonadota bacterium]